MDFIEIEGKTVEDAIEKTCKQLNLPEDQLNIEILSDGSTGLFGFMGMKKAKIRASLKEREDKELKDTNEKDKLALSKRILEEILVKLDYTATVDASDGGDKILLNINGDGSGLLIGRRGKTLDALQHIVDKIVNRSSEDRKRVIIDTEGYRERRVESLKNLALRAGEKVKKFGKPVFITPLNAHDRRIIHMALQNDHQLRTRSKGEGTYRKIVVSTKKSRDLDGS